MSFLVPIVLAYTNDILKLGFEAVGLEHSGDGLYFRNGVEVFFPADIPWSHGLLMSVVWSILAAIIIYLLCHDRRTAGMMGLVVMSHWFLDFIVHPPELPLLFSNSPKVGLGLWMTPQGNLIAAIIEGVMMISSLVLYFLYLRRKITPPVKPS